MPTRLGRRLGRRRRRRHPPLILRSLRRRAHPLSPSPRPPAHRAGRLLHLLGGAAPLAQSCVEASLRLSPSNPRALELLGQLCWQRGHLAGALHAFSAAAELAPSAEALREASAVMRQLAAADGGASESDLGAVAELAVAVAKRAVALDVLDGSSWYSLGLATLGHAFALTAAAAADADGGAAARALRLQSGRQMAAALSAMQQAQRTGLDALADLFYNRGTILCFLQEFGAALDDFRRAEALDGCQLPAAAQARSILSLVQQLAAMATAPRAAMARKMRAQPPVTGEHVRKLTPQRYAQARLATLATGRNDGSALVVRLLALMEQAHLQSNAARYAVAVDADASTVVLALVGVPGASRASPP